MNLWDKLRGQPLLKTPRHTVPWRWGAGTYYGDYKTGQLVSFEQMRLSYEQNSIIRACADTILAEAENAEWDIVPREEDGSDLKNIAEDFARDLGKQYNITDPHTLRTIAKTKHEELKKDQDRRCRALKKFFEKPNDDDDWDAFLHKVGHDILIMDAGGIEKEQYNGRAVSLWPVAGETVRVRTDEHGQVVGYIQGEGLGGHVDFDEDTLIYMIMNPRTNTPYGLSPIETVWREVATDLFQLGFTTKFFENNGTPPGLLTLFGGSEDEFLRFMSEVNSQKEENPSGIIVTHMRDAKNGNVAFTPLRGQGKDDSDGHVSLSDWIVRRVCAVYRVSPAQIGYLDGLGGLNSSTSDDQKKIHANKAVKPLLKLFERKMTTEVIHRDFGMRDLKFAFTYVDPDAEEMEHKRDMELLDHGVVTINEIRKKKGDAPKPWGDVPMNSQTLKNWDESNAFMPDQPSQPFPSIGGQPNG